MKFWLLAVIPLSLVSCILVEGPEVYIDPWTPRAEPTWDMTALDSPSVVETQPDVVAIFREERVSVEEVWFHLEGPEVTCEPYRDHGDGARQCELNDSQLVCGPTWSDGAVSS